MTIRTEPGGIPHRRVAWWVVSAWGSLGLLVAGGVMAAAGVHCAAATLAPGLRRG